MDRRLKRASRVALLALLAVGCTVLQPLEHSLERAPKPADAPLWASLSTVRDGDWQRLLDNGPEALDWRLLAIDSATETIELQSFLWFWDTAGSLVLDHLIRAAERGVSVRILIDDTFLISEDDLLLALHRHPGIEYRVFNPFGRRSSGMLTRQLLNAGEFHRLDHRMHNKAMVVDNRVAIVGGRNIADEYFGLADVANFRDLELLVGGPIVREISASFDDYWNDVWSFPIDALSRVRPAPVDLERIRHVGESSADIHEELAPKRRKARWLDAVRTAAGGAPRLYVDDPPGDDPSTPESQPVQLAEELVALFDGAAEEILIVSAYLIPTPELERAIVRALERGVSVRILTNSIRSNNHLAAHGAYRRHIARLLSAGAGLHEVRVDARDRHRYMLPPVDEKRLALHAKALVIDRDEIFVGSTNLDPRSLRLNNEMGLLVTSETLNAELRVALERDLAHANAWELRYAEDGHIEWVSGDLVLGAQPAGSFMQRIEDWFFAHLPIEGEL